MWGKQLYKRKAFMQLVFHFFPLLFTRADVLLGFLHNRCRLFMAGNDTLKISLS